MLKCLESRLNKKETELSHRSLERKWLAHTSDTCVGVPQRTHICQMDAIASRSGIAVIKESLSFGAYTHRPSVSSM